eukprot:589775-Amorphochlora_amoeboformis.AAC.1
MACFRKNECARVRSLTPNNNPDVIFMMRHECPETSAKLGPTTGADCGLAQHRFPRVEQITVWVNAELLIPQTGHAEQDREKGGRTEGKR